MSFNSDGTMGRIADELELIRKALQRIAARPETQPLAFCHFEPLTPSVTSPPPPLPYAPSTTEPLSPLPRITCESRTISADNAPSSSSTAHYADGDNVTPT